MSSIDLWQYIVYNDLVTGGHIWPQVVTSCDIGHIWSHLSHLVTGGHSWSQVVTGGHFLSHWSHVVTGGHILSNWSHLVTCGHIGCIWSQVITLVTSGHRQYFFGL